MDVGGAGAEEEECNFPFLGFVSDSHHPPFSQEIDDPSISCPMSEKDMEAESLLLPTSLENNNAIDGDTEMTAAPKTGMTFSSYDEVWDFYNRHAMQKGFGTKVKSSWCRKKTNVKYHALFTCCKEGFKESKEGALYRRPNIRVGCKAHMRIKLLESNKWEVISVDLEHNHEFSPSQSRRCRSEKRLESGTKRRLEEKSDDAGRRLSKSINSLVVDVGGQHNLSFGKKEARNQVDYKLLKLGEGDAEAMYKYFTHMQQMNPNFFYLVDLDKEGRLRNVFWADARSKAAYKYFGDVVTFDTTYLTNKYDLKLATFVGVNHHGQSVLLGCSLLADETVEAFSWVFQAWLTAMLGCPPNAIVTDQSKSIQRAIHKVFPKSRHRMCLWHIMKKISEKLGRLSEYKVIKKAMRNIMYNSMRIDEFELAWTNMIKQYGLVGNEWLTTLYRDRQQWVPIYLKDIFFAGMSTTERSESLDLFFDGYVNEKTSLKEFVEKYNSALHDKYEKEAKADFESFYTDPVFKTSCCLERQIADLYTRGLFLKFQDEVYGMASCSKSLPKAADGPLINYSVKERIIGKKTGQSLDLKVYEVLYNTTQVQVCCSCRLFEYKGILCKHALCVLNEFVDEIPSQYILSRWRKDFKRKYILNHGSNCTDVRNPLQRYDVLYQNAIQIVDEGVISESSYNLVLQGLQELKKRVQSNNCVSSVLGN